jgi:chorismate mutase/prephenate dehydratase
MSTDQTEAEKLLALRNKIDAIDEEIGRLISARAEEKNEIMKDYNRIINWR